MKINTNQFGEVEFDESMIIHFKDGILGFENYKKYLLINSGSELFLWLTSIDEPEIVFPLCGVMMLMEEYPQQKGFEPFGIVKLDKDPLKITVNLKAPVYINQNEKTGFQKILDEDELPIDYILFKE
ncbi:MAG: flagellar assembly protein FliW, partial [Ignavibacteria bacterium]|nr:flagellar assembly protein FliW [Ignavibacteria bacterium]